MRYRPMLDAFIATSGVIAVCVINLPVIWLLGAALAAYVAGRTKDSHDRQILEDQLAYLEKRGDRTGDLSLERELEVTRRRLAGLLANPSVYERARRVMGPMTDLRPGELTEELAAITDGSKTVWDFPDLVLNPNRVDVAAAAR